MLCGLFLYCLLLILVFVSVVILEDLGDDLCFLTGLVFIIDGCKVCNRVFDFLGNILGFVAELGTGLSVENVDYASVVFFNLYSASETDSGENGKQKRMSLKYTRAMVTAALNGDSEKGEFFTDKTFGVQVPKEIAGVPSALLDPVNTWEDKAE